MRDEADPCLNGFLGWRKTKSKNRRREHIKSVSHLTRKAAKKRNESKSRIKSDYVGGGLMLSSLRTFAHKHCLSTESISDCQVCSWREWPPLPAIQGSASLISMTTEMPKQTISCKWWKETSWENHKEASKTQSWCFSTQLFLKARLALAC